MHLGLCGRGHRGQSTNAGTATQGPAGRRCEGTRKERQKEMRHQLRYFTHYHVLYIFVYINQELCYLKSVRVARFPPTVSFKC